MTVDLIRLIEKLRSDAESLERDRMAAERALRKRDASLTGWLDSVRRALVEVEKDKPKAAKRFRAEYGELPEAKRTDEFLLKLAYLNLEPQRRWKYLRVLRYADQIGWKGSIKKMLRGNSGINGCVVRVKKKGDAEAKQKTPAKGFAKSKAVTHRFGQPKDKPAD